MKYRIDVQHNHLSPLTPVFHADDLSLAQRVFVAMTEIYAVVRLMFERPNGVGDDPVAVYSEPSPYPDGPETSTSLMEAR